MFHKIEHRLEFATTILMDINKIILKIIPLPATYHLVRNQSIYSLLQETGYFEMHDQGDELKILGMITVHPEYIKDWLQYSDDKRTSSGWYFRETDNGRSIVGYYPDMTDKKFKVYSNINEACATFIKLELEQIRK